MDKQKNWKSSSFKRKPKSLHRHKWK